MKRVPERRRDDVREKSLLQLVIGVGELDPQNTEKAEPL
jgi:hypothetical protein